MGKIYCLGTGKNFDISSIVGIENVGKYESNNFLVVWPKPSYVFTQETLQGRFTELKSSLATTNDFVKTYDKVTGILTITGGTLNYYIGIYNHDGYWVDKSHTVTTNPIVYFIDGVEIVSE